MNQLVPIFKALSDSNRLLAFAALLCQGELCACQITELLQVSGATVSRHMGVLSLAGLVESRKDGRWVYYRLRGGASALPEALVEWIGRETATDTEMRADMKRLKGILAREPEALCREQRGEKCCPRGEKNNHESGGAK